MKFKILEVKTQGGNVHVAVKHDEFANITNDDIEDMFKDGNNENKVLVDIKGVLDRQYFEKKGYNIFKL